MKRSVISTFSFLFFLFSFFVQQSYCLEGKQTVLSIDEAQAVTHIDVHNCVTPDLEKIILDGIPVILLFDITLYKHSRIWFDQKLSSLELKHTIKYDNLKDVFVIDRNGDGMPARVVASLAEAKTLICNTDSFTMNAQKTLNPKKIYYITYKVEAAIETDTENSRLPLFLDYLSKPVTKRKKKP